MNTCKDCKFSYSEKLGETVCRRYPPQAMLMPMPGKLAGQINVTRQTFFPGPPSDQWCGEYQPHIRVAN